MRGCHMLWPLNRAHCTVSCVALPGSPLALLQRPFTVTPRVTCTLCPAGLCSPGQKPMRAAGWGCTRWRSVDRSAWWHKGLPPLEVGIRVSRMPTCWRALSCEETTPPLGWKLWLELAGLLILSPKTASSPSCCSRGPSWMQVLP